MSQSMPVGAIVSQTDSELMPNYQASSTVSALHPIGTVHDQTGDPAIFSIGNDQQLWVCFRDGDEPTGWRQVSLDGGLPSGTQVAAFDTTQVSTGEFAIALATKPSGGQTSSVVYFTSWLSNDFKDTDWSAFADNWTRRDPEIPTNPDALGEGSQPVANAVATDILMGSQGSADKPAAIIVVVQEGPSANHYFVNGDPSSTLWSWTVYPLPENPDRILDLAFGYVPAGPGVFGTYVLYEIGGTRELYFVGATAPVADQNPYNLKLDVNPAAESLASLADPVAPHYSNLYVGGTGIDFYAHQTQTIGGGGVGVRIPGSDTIPAISQVEVAQDSANISIWMLSPSTQVLWYTTGPQPEGSDPGEWSAPLTLQQHVAHISALRHPTRHANQLVSALSNNELHYQWQDPATTLWRDDGIPLQDAGVAREFPSYTSVIHFEDEKQNPMIDMSVALTSSQWGYVTINGYLWELSPNDPVEVRTDSLGNLTIIAPTVTLGTPVYHVKAKPQAGSEPANLNPAAKAIQKLSQIRTAQDLLDQFPDLDQDAAEFGAKSISTLTDYIAGLPADGSSADGSQPANPLPNQIWGGDLSSGRLEIRAPETLLMSAPASIRGAMSTTQFSVVDTVEDIAGDVLHALESGIEAIGEFVFSVVKGVVRFAVKILGRWFHFVVKTISAALKLISWVFKILKIGLKAIIEFLGFIFAWDDIVETHKVFTNIARQTMNMLRDELPALQTRIDSAFDRIVGAVDSLGSEPLLPPDSKYASLSIDQIATQTTKSASSEGTDSTLYSAGGTFATYQILHGGILNGPAPEYGTGPQSIKDFIDDTLIPTLKEITDEIRTACQTLVRDYEAGTLTIGEVVGLLTKTLVETVVELLKTIVDGLFAIAGTLLDLLDNILFGEIQIPLLTPLYELVAGGSKMSVVDGFSLLASIPTTIFYKLVAFEAPFADGTGGLDTADSFKEILAILDGASGKVDTTAMALSEDTHDELAKIYSQVGGGIALLTSFVNSLATTVQVVSEGQMKFPAKISMGVLLLYMAGSIPFRQEDEIQQELADFVYLGNAIDTMIEAVLFFSPGVAEPEELIFKGGYELLMAMGDLMSYTVAFADKLQLAESDNEAHWDIETYAQNVVYLVSVTTGAVATIAGDENPEVEVPALVVKLGTQWVTTIMGLFRAAHTITQDVRYEVI